jgi:hypothetical protein
MTDSPSRQPDHNDEILANYFLTGVLGRALEAIDGERLYRTGARVPHTRGQQLEARVIALLERELEHLRRTFS